jgi:hypothetical protein
MLRRDPNYRRLKAGGQGAFGSASYWLGRDHLLVVAMAGYVETYRQFLFSDIQAVVVQTNRTRLISGSVLAALMVPCLAIFLVILMAPHPQGFDTAAVASLSVPLGLAVILGALLAANWLRGPTCACYLRTGIQVSPLPNITRWRESQRLLAALAPLVMQAQARLPATETPGPQQSGTTSDAGSGAPPAATPRYVVDDPNAPPRIIP